MPIVKAQSTLRGQDSAIRLARYAQIIEYDECAFWGVFTDTQNEDQCREIWLKRQRDSVADALAEAQKEIEQETGFFMHPRWVVGDLNSQSAGNYNYVDVTDLTHTVLTRWMYVIEPGVKAESNISLGESVSHATDPTVIGPVAVPSGTTIDEVFVYHPGTDIEITPSDISISGGNVTINIPRCRMVQASLADNPKTGLDYNVLANFESTVDIKRIYNDGSINAVISSAQSCCAICGNAGCTTCTQAACMRLVDGKIGHIEVRPATFSGGAWINSSLTCCQPAKVGLNYRAGLQSVTWHQEMSIVRLAHTKMPTEPCGCKITQRLWDDDRQVPRVLTRERINCKFGLSNGAWFAWQQTQAMRVVRAVSF